jgi:hypothetical protein
VLKECLDLLCSLPVVRGGSLTPLSIYQLDQLHGYAGPPTTASTRQDEPPDGYASYQSDAAFAGDLQGRQAYDRAAKDWCSNVGHLLLLARTLGLAVPATGVTQDDGAAGAQDGGAAPAAAALADGSSLAWAQQQLQVAKEQLLDALKALQDAQPEAAQLSELGSSVDDWSAMLRYAKLTLQPEQVVGLVAELKRQRQVVQRVLQELPVSMQGLQPGELSIVVLWVSARQLPPCHGLNLPQLSPTLMTQHMSLLCHSNL